VVDFQKYIPHSHWANAFATVFLVGVGIWGVTETKKALELTQRAWVSALGANLTRALENGKGVYFAVQFLNTGREPAIDANLAIENFTIDSYDPNTTDLVNIEVPTNKACDNLHPLHGRSVIVPTQPGTPLNWIFDSTHGKPPLYVDERIFSGSKYYGFNGCIAYHSYSETHRTKFCYVLEYKLITITPQQPSAGQQPGQAAGQPPATPVPPAPANQTLHAGVFVTCGKGWESD
jgi:hypothetical protein